MKINMGQVDRAVRIALAVVFILAIVLKWVTGAVAVILGVLAVVFIGTAVVRFCPLYIPFGIKTFRRQG